MARFFIVSINYEPEPTGFAPKATALAEHLARQAHDVHVFTGFPFAPNWRRRDEDRGRFFSTRRTGNLTVHRVTHFIPRRPSSAVERILMEGSFSVSACAAMIVELLGRSGRPDAILYIGAQPTLAMLARFVSSLAGCPYFVNITDLAARAALDVGIVSNRLSRLLEAFEFAAYRKAAGAGVLCQSFQDALVEHGYPSSRIHLNRDPTDLELIRPVARDGAFRTRYNIPQNAAVVLYAGSMGRKQGLRGVVSAASLTRDANICWVLTGDGESHDELVEAVRAGNLEDTVLFVPFQPDADIAAMFADADMLLLNQISAVKDTVIPSKLLTYMAAGRPVLAAVNPISQAAQLIRESDGGVLVPRTTRRRWPQEPDGWPRQSLRRLRPSERGIARTPKSTSISGRSWSRTRSSCSRPCAPGSRPHLPPEIAHANHGLGRTTDRVNSQLQQDCICR